MSAKPIAKAPVVRCEVCRRPLDPETRPDPRRRRCADHLDQQPLFPLAAVTGRSARRTRKGGSSS